MSYTCNSVNMGQIDYMQGWDLQRTIAQRVAEGVEHHTLLLLQHTHVYTLGRRGKQSDLLLSPSQLEERGIQAHWTDRGGEATYHGPGQLVAYPILNLRQLGMGPLRYVRSLEEVVIRTLGDFHVDGYTIDRLTGVWVDGAKMAAIGVKISRGVTAHGLALNVSPDLSFFQGIVPCGLHDRPVTSMAAVLGRQVNVDEVAPLLAHHFGEVLGLDVSQLRENEPIRDTVAAITDSRSN